MDIIIWTHEKQSIFYPSIVYTLALYTNMTNINGFKITEHCDVLLMSLKYISNLIQEMYKVWTK